MDETDVALYRYNGLNMRLMWQDDADADSTLESSERFYVMFDERWRPAATFRDADATPKEAFVWHAAGPGGFGGSSYIDSIILRDRDNFTGGTPNPMTSASDGTLEERRVFCQNWRADVVAVTKSDGTPIEYVRYSPYGEPTVYPVADLNMDGVVNSTDSGLWSDLLYSTSNASVYADSDLDFDGLDDWNSGGADGDLFYESYNANLGLSGVGRVSSAGVANRVGYAGYQWDQTISACHVRYRVYLPDIGRWTRRDPLGYVGGKSLLEYVHSECIRRTDASGLLPVCTKANQGSVEYDVPAVPRVVVTPNGASPDEIVRIKNIKHLMQFLAAFDGECIAGRAASVAKHIFDDVVEAKDILDLYIDETLRGTAKFSGASIWTEVTKVKCKCSFLWGCSWSKIGNEWIECKGGPGGPPIEDLFEFPVTVNDIKNCRRRVRDDIPRIN